MGCSRARQPLLAAGVVGAFSAGAVGAVLVALACLPAATLCCCLCFSLPNLPVVLCVLLLMLALCLCHTATAPHPPCLHSNHTSPLPLFPCVDRYGFCLRLTAVGFWVESVSLCVGPDGFLNKCCVEQTVNCRPGLLCPVPCVWTGLMTARAHASKGRCKCTQVTSVIRQVKQNIY